jgi:hypothetical protein
VVCPISVADIQAHLRLESPQTAIGVLSGLTNQAVLLNKYSQGVLLSQSATQAQIALAASFQKSVGQLLSWAKNPRVKSELFMYRKSATAEKFSKLVSIPLEKLILILNSFLAYLDLTKILPITQGRARIMSIRGLALSCAPNLTRISDINSFSRLYRGFA